MTMMDRLSALLPRRFRKEVPLVPVVRLSGVIGQVMPLRPGLSLAGVARLLERAFSLGTAKAVAICLNSPGGSPVQSHLIYRRIRQLAEEKKIPVLVFIEDVGASGGYMIACAGDEIYCDASSIVGSIGVVGASFGFQELIKKIGVERRVYTAGERKVTLDPFLPENPEDVARLQAIPRDIHASFIALVKASRRDRLKENDDLLFSGEFWSGDKALALGLVDGLGDMREVLRRRFGDKVRIPLIQPSGGLLSRMMGRGSANTGLPLASGLASGLAEEALAALDERTLWARYGL
jgi:signal peptide peptidase SppA